VKDVNKLQIICLAIEAFYRLFTNTDCYVPLEINLYRLFILVLLQSGIVPPSPLFIKYIMWFCWIY